MAIDDIVEQWDGLFFQSMELLRAKVCDKLASAGIELTSVEGLQEVFQNVPSPFEGGLRQYLSRRSSIVKLFKWW